MEMEVLPDPIMVNGDVAIIMCPKCGAVNLGGRPHGEEPCPFAVLEMAANREMLEAQKAYYERAGFATNDMTTMLQQITDEIHRLDPEDDAL